MDSEAKKKHRFRPLIIAYLIIVIVLLIAIYGIPKIFTLFVDSYTAKYDTVLIGETVECLVIRNEVLETSNASGSTNRLVSDGELVKKNVDVITLSGKKVKSPINGYVSYRYDGLEAILTPESISSMTKDDFKRIKGQIEIEGSEYKLKEILADSVSSGEPLFKIVDNYNWYIVAYMPHSLADNFTVGKNETVEFEDGTQVIAKVESKEGEELQTKVVFKTSRYIPNLDKLRLETIKLVTKTINGIVLETSSIIEIDGEKGVYVINKVGNAVFKRIKILGVSGDKTIVEKSYFTDKNGKTIATVKNYDTVKRIK